MNDGKRLRPVTVRVSAAEGRVDVALIEAEPDPGEEEAELDHDVWALVT